MILPHLIIHSSLHYLLTGHLWEVNNKGKFQILLAIKVVAVTYERWLLTRGSKYSDLTSKRLMFCKTGRRGEVVAYERWLQPELN